MVEVPTKIEFDVLEARVKAIEDKIVYVKTFLANLEL